MFDEVTKLKTRYAKAIEDGRRVEVFTSMPEWLWYVEHVIQPTIDDYIDRIMSGVILSDKEDYIMRGMVMGMKLIIETTANFSREANNSMDKLTRLEAQEKEDED